MILVQSLKKTESRISLDRFYCVIYSKYFYYISIGMLTVSSWNSLESWLSFLSLQVVGGVNSGLTLLSLVTEYSGKTSWSSDTSQTSQTGQTLNQIIYRMKKRSQYRLNKYIYYTNYKTRINKALKLSISETTLKIYSVIFPHRPYSGFEFITALLYCSQSTEFLLSIFSLHKHFLFASNSPY